MDFFRMFRRKAARDASPLRIDGVSAPLTPGPDDAELAAQALLESTGGGRKRDRRGRKEAEPAKGTPEYYGRLSERIRQRRAGEARLTMRYLACCEERLACRGGMDAAQASEMERELYRRQDAAEREGGEILRRWQRCLAHAILRQMPSGDGAMEEDTQDTPR